MLFAAICWAAARAILALAGRPGASNRVGVSVVFIVFAAFAAIYAVASVIFFGIFGGFLTYPLLALVGNLRMLSSSVAAQSDAARHPGARRAAARLRRSGRSHRPPRAAGTMARRRIAFVPLGVWLILGVYGFSAAWTTRQDRRIAENPHWVLVSSWWQVVSGDGTVRLTDQFSAADLSDFDPIGPRPPSPASIVRQVTRRLGRAVAAPRPPNVIVVVLESVAARWAGLNGGPYDSTPVLQGGIGARARRR